MKRFNATITRTEGVTTVDVIDSNFATDPPVTMNPTFAGFQIQCCTANDKLSILTGLNDNLQTPTGRKIKQNRWGENYVGIRIEDSAGNPVIEDVSFSVDIKIK